MFLTRVAGMSYGLARPRNTSADRCVRCRLGIAKKFCTPLGGRATNRRFYTQAQLDLFLGRRREAVVPTRVIAYCRVSSNAQNPDLTNQRRTLESFCAACGLTDVEWSDEVCDGLNFARKKFCEIMDAVERREVATRVIAHKDRLTRFGFAWFARLCVNHGCSLLVLDNEQLSPEREIGRRPHDERPFASPAASRVCAITKRR
jgi:predicted site-specific integrase-resolvase